MGITDTTYKKIKGVAQQIKAKTEGKENEVSDVFTAAERLLTHTVAHNWVMAKGRKSASAVVRHMTNVPLSLGGIAARWNLMTGLAGAIDRLMEEPVAEEPIEEVVEEIVEEVAQIEPIVEEVFSLCGCFTKHGSPESHFLRLSHSSLNISFTF